MVAYPFGTVRPAERACRVCRCTKFDACIDERTGMPCHWVAPDLCSACVPPYLEFTDEPPIVSYTPPADPLWVTGFVALSAAILISSLVFAAMSLGGH